VTLYERIESLAKEKGFSVCGLCKTAGVPHSTIYELKSGKKVDLNRKTTEKLAMALEITVDELYGKEKTPDTNVSEVDLRIANVFKVLTDEQKELFLNLAEQLIQQ
jgi:transcriptional regulator with XRE-family HTH domain